MHHTRTGTGSPLILIHGLGNTPRAWNPIVPALAAKHELITLTLPGHDGTPAEPDSGTFAGLTRTVAEFVQNQQLESAALVGSSLGARMVLELARRGHGGPVVALDPGGFWRGWERGLFKASTIASVRLLRLLRPLLPALSANRASRSALLAQLSARPWALDPKLVGAELASFAATRVFVPLVRDLSAGPAQRGPRAGTGRVTIGWGRHDRLCLPRQAARALSAFPGAELHWFERSGHFPMWDEPDAAARLILART